MLSIRVFPVPYSSFYIHACLTFYYSISVDHIVIGAAHCYCRYKEIPMHEVNIRTHPYIVGALSS